jgi:hypothetical protein
MSYEGQALLSDLNYKIKFSAKLDFKNSNDTINYIFILVNIRAIKKAAPIKEPPDFFVFLLLRNFLSWKLHAIKGDEIITPLTNFRAKNKFAARKNANSKFSRIPHLFPFFIKHGKIFSSLAIVAWMAGQNRNVSFYFQHFSFV